MVMRPLMVRMVQVSGPLFWSGLPVSGWTGGGKSRLRGVESHLDGGLVGFQAGVGEEVTHLLLAGVDDGADGRLIDGFGDALAELLEARTQEFAQSFRTELRGGRDGGFGRGSSHRRNSGHNGCGVQTLELI